MDNTKNLDPLDAVNEIFKPPIFYNSETKNPNEDSWVQGNVKEEASKNKQVKVPTYVTKASKK
jgi:hypothetical protein